ncbi:MAG: hypothetical protein [Microviridae sp. ctOsc38]|nr:MAG: hypothetical protein [Microviridae sp. ctOsc38]
MRGRRRMSKRRSRRLFTRTAKRVHRRNGGGRVMRGGVRL